MKHLLAGCVIYSLGLCAVHPGFAAPLGAGVALTALVGFLYLELRREELEARKTERSVREEFEELRVEVKILRDQLTLLRGAKALAGR